MAMRFQRKAAGRCKGERELQERGCLFLLEEERICRKRVAFQRVWFFFRAREREKSEGDLAVLERNFPLPDRG